MIYVNQEQVDQVEYLLGQAVQGNHVLFSPELVRSAITNESSFTDEDAYRVEPVLEKLIELPTLERKRAYLEQLDSSTLEAVVLAYFNIVENSLYENLSETH